MKTIILKRFFMIITLFALVLFMFNGNNVYAEEGEIEVSTNLSYQYNEEKTKLRFIGTIKTEDLSSIESIDLKISLDEQSTIVSMGQIVYTSVSSNGNVIMPEVENTYYSILVLTGIERYQNQKITAQLIVTKTDSSSVETQNRLFNLPYDNHHNFTEDFNLETSDSTWKYGSVNYHWGESETFDFYPLTDKNADAWLGTNIEVKSNWINFGNMMGIAYTSKIDENINVSINLTGGTDLTRASIRVGIKNSEGVLYSNPSFYGSDNNVIELSLDYELKVGDTIYFIFGNEAGSVEGAYPNGNLSIDITSVVKLGNFAEDFNLETSDGTWKYGSVNYHWGESETFDFIVLTEKTSGEDGWMAEGIEVKGGWINFGNMMGIAYTVEIDANINLSVNLNGGTNLTKASLRVGIKNSEGILYSNPSFLANDNIINLSLNYELKAGDTIYFIFTNEAGGVEDAYPNGELSISIFLK